MLWIAISLKFNPEDCNTLFNNLNITKFGKHFSNAYDITIFDFNLKTIFFFLLKMKILNLSERSLEMEKPRNIYIKHNFVDLSIQASEVSGFVLAKTVVLSIFYFFKTFLTFFSWSFFISLSISFMFLMLSNNFSDFYEFAQACKNYTCHISIIACVMWLRRSSVRQESLVLRAECELEAVTKLLVIDALRVQVVEICLTHLVYFLA